MFQTGVLRQRRHGESEKEKASMAGQEQVGEQSTRLVKLRETTLDGPLGFVKDLKNLF